MEKQRDREWHTGRYTFEGGLDRLCVCGHTFGNHCADAPHDCLTYSFSKDDPRYAECDCLKFRPSKKKGRK
jgi:hypothetical protein